MDSADSDNLRFSLVRGDQEAFSRLYDLLADRLHHYLTVLLGSRDAADDVLQETFVRLAETREKLRKVTHLTAYVFRVGRNEAWRRLRRARARPFDSGSTCSEILFEIPSKGDARAGREQAEWVAAALMGLSSRQREVVELKIYGGLTLAEIGRVTGRPPGTVATQYRTALRELRVLLGEEEERCPNQLNDS